MTLLYLVALALERGILRPDLPSTYATEFALLGFAVVARDRLHDRWYVEDWFARRRGRAAQLPWRMGLLVGTATALAALWDPVAWWGCLVVACSQLVDWLVFHANRRRDWLARTTASNAASTAVDALLAVLAFGAAWQLAAFGWLAAFAGASVWALVLPTLRVLPR